MPNIDGILLFPDKIPRKMTFTVNKDESLDAVIADLLHTSTVVPNDCNLGVIFTKQKEESKKESQDSEVEDEDTPMTMEPKNALATKLRMMFCPNMPHSVADTYGTCILLHAESEGVVPKMPKETRAKVFDVYEELTGRKITGNKVKRSGPKRAKRAFNFFSKDFQRNRRRVLQEQGAEADFVEITKEARTAWAGMNEEQKQPYETLAEQDKVRYDQEMLEYRKKHPTVPKRPRTAYNLYCKECKTPEEKKIWAEMDDEAKSSFVQAAVLDKERFQAECDVLETWCTENGVDFKAMMLRKKKKIGNKSKSTKKSTQLAKVAKKKDNSKKRKVKKSKD